MFALLFLDVLDEAMHVVVNNSEDVPVTATHSPPAEAGWDSVLGASIRSWAIRQLNARLEFIYHLEFEDEQEECQIKAGIVVKLLVSTYLVSLFRSRNLAVQL